jgi:hypothetical protein
MKVNALAHSGWEDAAIYIREREKKYGTSEMMVPAVVQPQTNDEAPRSPQTTLGEHMEIRDIVPGISQRPQGTS